MDIDDVLPPLPLEPPHDFVQNMDRAPPPPPLQTSSDAEVMDVSSGGDGYIHTPGDRNDEPHQSLGKSTVTFACNLSNEANAIPLCPRTARHAPQVTKFLPDLKLLRDVKIRVSFTESSSSKDRKVLYTGEGHEGEGDDGLDGINGELHDSISDQDLAEGSSATGNIAGRLSEENEVDMENKVEYAVLDEFEDFYENFLDHEDAGFKSDVIVQQEQADDEAVAFTYEVGLIFCLERILHLPAFALFIHTAKHVIWCLFSVS